MIKTVCDQPKKDVCYLYGELIGQKLREFDEKTRDFLMHEIDGLILRTKFQNQPPSLSLPGYQFQNVQSNIPSHIYSTYNYPSSATSSSLSQTQLPSISPLPLNSPLDITSPTLVPQKDANDQQCIFYQNTI